MINIHKKCDQYTQGMWWIYTRNVINIHKECDEYTQGTINIHKECDEYTNADYGADVGLCRSLTAISLLKS